jgi:hypothetical protein
VGSLKLRTCSTPNRSTSLQPRLGEAIFPIGDAANPPSHGPCRRARNSCTSMAAPVVTFASGLALQ